MDEVALLSAISRRKKIAAEFVTSSKLWHTSASQQRVPEEAGRLSYYLTGRSFIGRSSRSVEAMDAALPIGAPRVGSVSPVPLATASPLERTMSQKKAKGVPYGAVVHFTTHYINQRMLRPWKMGDPKTCTGSGFYIGERRILTNSHVVHNATR